MPTIFGNPTVKTGAVIHEANRIAAAKAKREARKSQLRPVSNAAAQLLSTCPRCKRTFRAQIGLVGHLRINCTSRTAPNFIPPPASSSSSLPPNNFVNSPAPPLPSSSAASSSSSTTTTTTTTTITPTTTTTAPKAAAQAAVSHISDRDTTTGTTPASPDSSNENQDYTCPHCDRTFTSHIGLVGHLRIHRTETGEPVPEAPTYTHRTRLHCPHCPRTFTHRMGLVGHMRIHESGIDHNSDTPTTPIMPSTTLAPSICATTNASSVADTDNANFSCPHCPRTFTSRIGLVGHLRIHRTETGEPVPGAPISPTKLVSTAHTVLALSGRCHQHGRNNHRGISLLNIAGKIFARILLNRLNNHLEQGLLPESQCGFRRHRAEREQAIVTGAIETMGIHHSSSSSMVCADAAVEVATNNQRFCLRNGRQEVMQVHVAFVSYGVRAVHRQRVGTEDGDEFASPERQAEARQTIVYVLRQTGQSSHDVVPDGKGDARVPSLCPGATAPEEGVAGTNLLQLASFGEAGPAECSDVHLIACQFPSH
nr:unnamed protein product [Spirometra erinaceieuropaei]